MATMKVLAGDPYMLDPGLLARLHASEVPTLLIWRASDRIVTPAYGQAMAQSFANASFAIVADDGHLPHVE